MHIMQIFQVENNNTVSKALKIKQVKTLYGTATLGFFPSRNNEITNFLL